MTTEQHTTEAPPHRESSTPAPAPQHTTEPPPQRQSSTPAPAQPNMWSRMAAAARQVGSACMQGLSAPAAGPLIFACVCVAIALKNRSSRVQAVAALEAEGRSRRPVLHRSLSMAALHGGRVAMQRIIDSAKARVDTAGLEDAARRMRELLAEEPLSFTKLQREAAKLEMSGKEDEAAEMLEKAWEKADSSGQPHEAHELQMLLVEMLIYKEEYDKALRCKCLQDKEISDARGPLYMAVIYTILDKLNEARECHKEFQDIQSRFFNLPDSFREGTLIFGAVHDFDKFKEVVKNLKEEIDHAHKVRGARNN